MHIQIYKRCESCGTQYQDSVGGLGTLRNTPVCKCGSQEFEHSAQIVPDWWSGEPEPASFVLEGGALPGLVMPDWAK